MTIDQAFLLIRDERMRQEAKWGPQSHDTGTWLQILSEEVGEYSEACLHDKFGGPKKGHARAELIQLAAVAVQMLEKLDMPIPVEKIEYTQGRDYP